MSSVVAITDTIRATISDADDIEAVGKAVETNIVYDPAGGNAESGSQVFITYAEASQTGDIFVKFNKDVDFAKLYTDFTNNANVITVTDSNGAVNPTDIIKVDSNTVKLVLDETDAVNDNDTITITGRNTDPINGALLAGAVSFNLVDPKAPEALSVATPDYRTIVVRFTEAVSSTTTDIPGNWVLNGKKLTANDLVGGTPVVGTYDMPEREDNRSYVTLQLTADGAAKLKASGSQNLLQAYDIIDYAGLTDKTGQNKATTQEFRFITPEAPAAPTVTVTKDSPEQFRVKFNSPLKTALTAADFGFKYQTDQNTDGTPVWGGTVELENTNTTASKATVTNIGGAANDEYLIELNEDWTVKLDTNSTGINYYAPKHNKVQITVNKANAHNLADVQMIEDKVEVITMSLDATSPEIAEAVQTVDINDVPEQRVRVTMSEPVQMASTTPLTPSQKQVNNAGIPVPTFQFVNADGSVTIDGQLDGTVDEEDMTFNVIPVAGKTLNAGTWTLYIRSISDDIGNTSSTTSEKVEIKAEEVSLADPIIVWADVHDNVAFGSEFTDVVHIQFAKEMSLDALTSSMYTINGKILPQGVNITSAETYYDMNDDGVIDADDTRKGTLVTIKLPKGFLGDTTETEGDSINISNSGANILNVSKSLTDAEGNKIKTPTEVKMSYDFDGDSSNIVHPNTVSISSVKEETKGVLGTAGTAGSAEVPGTKQVETATVAGTVTADPGADVVVTVTANATGLTDGKDINVAVLKDDTAAAVAGKIKAALDLDEQVTAVFDITVSGADVILTAKSEAANDGTLNVAIDGTTNTTGITDAATSVDTTEGVATTPEVPAVPEVPGTAEKASFTVLEGSVFGEAIEVTVKDGNKKLGADGVTVNVTLTAGDDIDAVATKIQAAIAGSGINAHYTSAVVDNKITLTQVDNVTGGDVTLSIVVKY